MWMDSGWAAVVGRRGRGLWPSAQEPENQRRGAGGRLSAPQRAAWRHTVSVTLIR